MAYIPGDDPGIENPETIYSIYRDYIKHEDELINKRLMADIVFQGFLFAAYAVSIEFLRRPTTHPRIAADLKFLPFMFPVLGCVVGILVIMSIAAAQSAIEGLKKDWTDILSQIDPKMRARLPGLTGAGKKLSNNLGKAPPIGIAAVIMAAWIPVFWFAR
jgi:hypothetical protein